MRNPLLKFLLTTVLLNISLNTNNLHAQNIIQNVQFDQITNENGRSLGFITGIEQDSAGFLWFASRNGLIQYDGYSFTYFNQGKHSRYLLPFNNVTFSYYDRNKILWLKYVDNLYLFEDQKISNRFDTILQNRFRHNTQVVQDIENNYWIGPHEQLLYKFNPQKMEIDTFTCQTNQINPNTVAQLKQNSKKAIYGTIIYQISISQSGFPLISTNKAIQEYDPKTKRFRIIEKIEVPDSVRNYIIIPIIETLDNTYLYAIQNKLFLKNKRKLSQIDLKSVDKVTCIMSDFENNLWLGTTNGLFVINLCNSNLQQNIVHIKSTTENQLYSDKIWKIFEDHSHNIWIGTDKGLNRYRKSKFNIINIDNERFSAQPMATDNKGDLFFLTHQGKWTVVKKHKIEQSELPKSIFKYEQQTGEYIFDFNDLIIVDDKTCFFAMDNKIGRMDKAGNLFRIRELYNSKSGNENFVTRIISTNKGIWVATTEKMILFDNNLNLIKQVNHPKTYEDDHEATKDFVKDVIWTGKSTLTVRTETEIYSLSTNDLKIDTLYKIPQFNKSTTSSEGNLVLDADSCLWFVVFPQLVSITKNGELFETTIEIPEDISNSKITFIDSTMLIYSNKGLLKIANYRNILDSKPEKLTSDNYDFYTSQEGLADNLITGIIAGKQNNIWATTFKGLSFMDLNTGEIQNYFYNDDSLRLGFPGGKIARSDKQSKTAILQVTNGIMTFVPDSINPFIPNVVINKLLIFNKEFETDTMLWNKKFIKLKYNQNFLTIGFSALDFTQPNKNKYRYRMENLNEEWIYTDANNRKAIFAGIPPGVYRFTVQGSNNDGLWNTKGQTIIIKITPPWWQTTAAYIIYIVIAIAGIFAFMKIRERKLITEKRILEEKVSKRTHEIMMQNEKIQKQSDKIARQHKRITDSIQYARRIQTALLPSEEHILSVFPSHFVLWLPRDIVSGDFFWINNNNDLTIAVAADCTGHGVPGAFMSMLGIAFLNELVNKDRIFETNEILNHLRTNIIRSLKQTGEDGGSKDGMDISMCAINHTTLIARFSGAYNPLIIIRNNEIFEYKADKMPIGYIGKNEMFSYQDIQLQLGDRLYMYSDGYIDQFGGKEGRRFSSKKLRKMLSETRNLSMQEQKVHLIKTLETWMENHEQVDDILVFGIEITN